MKNVKTRRRAGWMKLEKKKKQQCLSREKNDIDNKRKIMAI